MIVDTHCHYNLAPLYENWQDHWLKAQSMGIVKALVVGTDIETSRRSINIANQSQNLFSAIGVHPHEYTTINPADLPTVVTAHSTSLSMIMTNKKVIAIGETGLDYYRLDGVNNNQLTAAANQQAGLKMHINLANHFKKILIVHVRDRGGNKNKNNQAYWDTLNIVQTHYQFKQPLILHCLSGPKKYIQAAVKLGAFFGVAANVTYPNAQELRNLLSIIPQKQLLLETDAPFLPPQKFRGQSCEPWMIAQTASYLQTKLDITINYQYFASKYLSPVQ